MHSKKRILRVSWLWLPYLIILPFLPVAKIIGYIFLILSLHEMAHILCAILFHYPIRQVTIYPFGLAATISYIGYGNLIKETIILCAGPLSHVLMPHLFLMFYEAHWISASFLSYLKMINASILIFNLLPIYPLDGGRLLQVFFHSFLRFTPANKATLITSVIVIFWILTLRVLGGISGLIVLIFLFLQIISSYRRLGITRQQFYHYRLHHPVQYPLIMNEKSELYRGRYNMIHRNRGWMREEDWLQAHFPYHSSYKEKM